MKGETRQISIKASCGVRTGTLPGEGIIRGQRVPQPGTHLPPLLVALLDHLAGTPRFADYLDWTPFHNYCRSSIVLYLPEYDDGLTELMRESAQQVLKERERGEWRDRQSADAFL